MSIASIKISIPNAWGGFAAPSFSDISFSPDMFAVIWPPPETAAVKMTWIDGDDETVGTVIFDGTAVLSEVAHDGIKYQLKRPENETKVAKSTVYNDTLNAVITTLCGASYLNLTIDTTRARIPSPALVHTTTEEKLTVDLVSEFCQSFSHAAIQEGSTFYLVDMYDLTTTQTEVSEWDVLPSPGPKYGTRYSLAKSGDYSASSATVLNGEELSATIYHTAQGNIEAALAIMLEIANRPMIELNAIVGAAPIKIGGCYLFDDNSHVQPLQTVMVASDVVYNFDSDTLQATGPGSVSA